MTPRIGFGFDVHRLEQGRELWLGGIRLDAEKGAVGHSDADVLLHALCDALLGAAALGDIGQHFPDTDPTWKGIDSKKLLKAVWKLVQAEGYAFGNADLTLVLERPKIAPHVKRMRKAIAEVLDVPIGDISIKATTNEKVGYLGREEGVCAYAVVLIQRL